ncbi:DUF2332 domain-containing protein [Pacificimonas sp. WHA3]|uniref:DUF2332 domain-containing protein n=1 Tax=Pacificimonas pallii TaxID=2827236 RepID=A0ABS6SC68_9SPHN|nr:DUF2332 domain-containing protein [Pacificimonas pallii]MBV7256014.1 DUF2332 domain-containing protein [Pacificimonas pallii]
MTDWRTIFHEQARWCETMGAPFMALLCDALPGALTGDADFSRRIREWPGDEAHATKDALVMRVTGALNAVRRAGRLPQLDALYPPAAMPGRDQLAAALKAAIASVDADLLPWLGSAPQTNEVGRSGALMPGLMTIAAETGLTIRLFEVGASAGLNLRLDDYAYDFGGLKMGNRSSAVRIRPIWRGMQPPAAEVRITERRGVDLNPLDVTDEATRAALMAYVWPDQQERVTRLEAALARAAADPPPIDRGDAAAWTERHLHPAPGTVTVLMHSVALQYFPADSQRRIHDHMTRIGNTAPADAPLAWLSYEMAEVGKPMHVDLTLWPAGEKRLLGLTHPHGTEIEWRHAASPKN